MLNPLVSYPLKFGAADLDYPWGIPRDVTVSGDGSGSPWVSGFFKDIFGPWWFMFERAGITPNEVPETAQASQGYSALHSIFRLTTWHENQPYIIGDRAMRLGTIYKCLIANINIDPNGDLTETWEMDKTPSIGGRYKNLTASRPSASTIQMAVDEMELTNSNDNPLIIKNISGASSLFDITTDLDTGPEASSQWYDLYIIAKANGTTGRLMVKEGDVPVLPSEYIYINLWGKAYNDAGGDLVDFHQVDDEIAYVTKIAAATGFINTTYNSNDLSSIVPLNAKLVQGVLFTKVTNTSTVKGFVSSKADGTGELPLGMLTPASGGESLDNFEIKLIESQTMYSKIAGGGNLFGDIDIVGFTLRY